jgi:hypothetical protein
MILEDGGLGRVDGVCGFLDGLITAAETPLSGPIS